MKNKLFMGVVLSVLFTLSLTVNTTNNQFTPELPTSNASTLNEKTLDDFNLSSINETKFIEVLKSQGVIPEDARMDEAYSIMTEYLRNVEDNYKKGIKVSTKIKDSYIEDYKPSITSGRGNKLGLTESMDEVTEENWTGSVRTDKVLVILVDYADYKHNSITQGETDMYYPDYTKDHYQDMIFGENGYTGPNGENLMSMKQYYEAQSGGSYSVEGNVAGWYTVSKDAAYYGAPNGGSNDSNARELIYEALLQVGQDPTVNLSEYDQWDRDDYDQDGVYAEPDGIIDHLMVIHAGMGQEAGGGSLGENAIWSHRWNLGGLVAVPGGTSDSDRFGGLLGAYDYTIEPEDGAMGVFAHEFGHDLGLPDEYDTIYSGTGEAVSRWSIMAGGSWTGAIGGTEPTGFSPFAKEYLQSTMPGSNWLHGLELDLEDIPEGGINAVIDQASSKGINNDYVRINLPEEKVVNSPKTGEYQYFGGTGNDLVNIMLTPVDLTDATNATLSFDAWFNIEKYWDLGYVVAYDEFGNLIGSIDGNLSLSNQNNPYASYAPLDYGITGDSNGWTEGEYDLSQFAGENIYVGFLYYADSYVEHPGLYVDNISIRVDNVPVLKDGAEEESQMILLGFDKVNEGTVNTEHYYLVEWRNHQGVDKGLAEPGILSGLTFEEGMLIWYVDTYYSDNHTGLYPGKGFLGVVDADQYPVKWDDDSTPVNHTGLQIHDATFSIDKSDKLYYDFGGYGIIDHYAKRNVMFDDSNDYSNPDLPDAGRKIPNYGLKVRVIGQSDDKSVGKILITR